MRSSVKPCGAECEGPGIGKRTGAQLQRACRDPSSPATEATANAGTDAASAAAGGPVALASSCHRAAPAAVVLTARGRSSGGGPLPLLSSPSPSLHETHAPLTAIHTSRGAQATHHTATNSRAHLCCRPLLADEPVVGEGGPDPAEHQLLAPPVRLRHQVRVACGAARRSAAG